MERDRGGILLLRYSAATALLVLMATFCSCCGSRPDGDSWLLMVGGDTLTVEAAGDIWNGLGPQERQRFLEAEDAVASFVVSLARREMVLREIDRLEYLNRPEVAYTTGASVRRTLYETAVDSARTAMERAVSEEDVRFFRELMGKTVWYTLSPNTPESETHGPVHLPELRRSLALCLDTLSHGQTADCAGETVRLDSLYATDPELVAATLEDTARVASLARSRLAEARYAMLRDSLRRAAIAASEIDTAALESMATEMALGRFVPDSADILIDGPMERWSEHKLLAEIGFASETRPVDPSSPEWLHFFAEGLLLRNAFVSWLERRRPDLVESAISAGDGRRRSRAVDLLFSEMVAESVSVSTEQIEERYTSLPEPIMMPERRRLSLVVFPREDMERFRRVLEDPERSPADVFDPYPWFRDTTAAGPVTEPLSRTQLPPTLSDTVFSLEPGDTTRWHGPFPIPRLEMMSAARLDEVIPPRAATLEEASDSLRSRLRAEGAQARLEEWMAALESRYDLRINDAILDRLPPDPALWSSL
jgi:hypothetical protein